MLGLHHSRVADSVMLPYFQGYKKDFKLSSSDIYDVQQLHGSSPPLTHPSTRVAVVVFVQGNRKTRRMRRNPLKTGRQHPLRRRRSEKSKRRRRSGSSSANNNKMMVTQTKLRLLQL